MTTKKELKDRIYDLEMQIIDLRILYEDCKNRNEKLKINDMRLAENIKYIQFIEDSIPEDQLNSLKLFYLESRGNQ
jgi:hypothetical protein